MPPAGRPNISNRQADLAGDVYRIWVAGDVDERRAQIRDLLMAMQRMIDYRSLHAYPLRKVTVGVRQMIATELGPNAPRPGQRLKRMDRITPKLTRFPHMRLSQMEDIGGCRAVFENLADLYAVAARIRRRWPHARVIDYIQNPKPDGYRGLHIIERRDGRQIEVQLRTRRQHEWAEAVETAQARTGHNVKDGRAPADLTLYFQLAAERLAREDAGQPPDPELEERFDRLRERVRPYFAQ